MSSSSSLSNVVYETYVFPRLHHGTERLIVSGDVLHSNVWKRKLESLCEVAENNVVTIVKRTD